MEEHTVKHPRVKSPTSGDVARRAGVSRTAVSYVLNGTRHAHVSEETRFKVLQAVHDLGYHMNTSAQTLRRGQSNEICFLSDILVSTNDAEILVAMQQQAQHYGYVPVSYFMGGMSREQRQELLYKIAARRPLALLLFLECMNAEWIEQAQQMGVEHILLGTAEPLTDPLLRAFPSVSLPVREIGYVAAQHLLERGHRHLAVVHPGDGRHEQAFQERLQGMQEALMKWSGMADVQLDILPLHLSLADAQDLVARYFCGPLHPTGVYAFNDEYALPLMAALSDRGLSIPTDVAMIGTDNTSFSAFVRPALTTISFDNVAFGHRFIDILHVLQQGKPLPEELMRPLVPQLILRAST